MEAPNRAKPYIIVVGIDYSELGDEALLRGFEHATIQQHAEVHVVHVARTYGSNVYLEVTGALTTVSIEEASERLRAYVQTKLEEFRAAKQDRSGVLFERVVTHLRLDGPAEDIAQLASDLEADLVVVGTHGRRGLRRLLLGSVAEGVVRLAPAPVLVVRPKTFGVAESGPIVEPPCPRCVETRRESNGKELWCEQHRERHGRRHTYHHLDRNSSARENMSMVVPMEGRER
jgi:nucleotide-binding universal stress UspA family protein